MNESIFDSLCALVKKAQGTQKPQTNSSGVTPYKSPTAIVPWDVATPSALKTPPHELTEWDEEDFDATKVPSNSPVRKVPTYTDSFLNVMGRYNPLGKTVYINPTYIASPETTGQIREKYRKLGIHNGTFQPSSLNPLLIDYMKSQQYTEGVDMPIDLSRGTVQYLSDAVRARQLNSRYANVGQSPQRAREFVANTLLPNYAQPTSHILNRQGTAIPTEQAIAKAMDNALMELYQTGNYDDENSRANSWFREQDIQDEANTLLDYYKNEAEARRNGSRTVINPF